MWKAGAAAALALLLLPASTASPAEVVSEGPAPYADAQELVVHSQALGRDFVVDVTAPIGPPPAGGRYPALYALDGGHHVAGVIAEQLERSGAIAPAYVIAIGYRDDEWDRRADDLLYQRLVQHAAPMGGGGAAFERFLTKDLRPLLEARYPLDPRRAILLGHSYGGLFAANVLARSPDDFAGYMVASPSVWADPAVVERLRSSRA